MKKVPQSCPSCGEDWPSTFATKCEGCGEVLGRALAGRLGSDIDAPPVPSPENALRANLRNEHGRRKRRLIPR